MTVVKFIKLFPLPPNLLIFQHSAIKDRSVFEGKSPGCMHLRTLPDGELTKHPVTQKVFLFLSHTYMQYATKTKRKP